MSKCLKNKNNSPLFTKKKDVLKYLMFKNSLIITIFIVLHNLASVEIEKNIHLYGRFLELIQRDFDF